MKSDMDKKIIAYLKRKKSPTTTDEIAKWLKISWNTAQVRLLKLAANKKIKFAKVGRQNEFWV